MPSAAVEKHLAAFNALKTNLFHKDFLLTWEHSTDEIKAILTLAEALKLFHQEGISYRAFDSGLAISIFRDNSPQRRARSGSRCRISTRRKARSRTARPCAKPPI